MFNLLVLGLITLLYIYFEWLANTWNSLDKHINFKLKWMKIVYIKK